MINVDEEQLADEKYTQKHFKLVYKLMWVITISVAFTIFTYLYLLDKGWTFYGVFFIGGILMVVDFILGIIAFTRLEGYLKYYGEKNPYEE